MNDTVRQLIELYNFTPLPVEGTLFHQSYKKKEGTAIIGLYCHEPQSRSLFHKLTEDEIWHFYGGDPFRLILLFPDGISEEVIMGPDPLKGHSVQYVVPRNVWQAGELLEESTYALYGCTMAPGFHEGFFEGGTESRLLPLYGEREKDIKRLSCPEGQTEMS